MTPEEAEAKAGAVLDRLLDAGFDLRGWQCKLIVEAIAAALLAAVAAERAACEALGRVRVEEIKDQMGGPPRDINRKILWGSACAYEAYADAIAARREGGKEGE